MNDPSSTDTGEPHPSLSGLCQAAVREVVTLLKNGSEGAETETIVHQTRVLTKRLRAAWNLARELAPDGLAATRRQALRDLSAGLGDTRDRTVLQRLCAKLIRRKDTKKSSRAAFSIISERLRCGPADCQPLLALGQIREILEEETAAWDALGDGADRKALLKRFAKAREKARALTDKALVEIAPETWHDWRKALKEVRYQSEFLAALEGRLPHPDEVRVRRLGTLLGQWNDLVNLESKLNSVQGQMTARQFEAASKMIRGESGKLVKKCRALAAKLKLG